MPNTNERPLPPSEPGTNRLAREKSPYLLQHADNPVDWYPWGEEAFELARREDKPVFLSIGYSSCHWCHVMAHESFEDEQVAALMNDAFVNIKVDREERPDIDVVYMTVAQLMTGRGGWPLNIIMTPDKVPFFAATYIPKNDRFGQEGMLTLVPAIQEQWQENRVEVLDVSKRVHSALQEIGEAERGEELGEDNLRAAYEQLASRFDAVHGGFGKGTKFPTPHNLLFLLRYWKRSGEEHALSMVEQTLQAMRNGGMFDHVGFGFHRYSTDAEWLLPHFEKMLYDQALLAMAYAEAYQATGKREYRQTAEETITYVLRDMVAQEGGFFSAEDADSEGEEGKFYVWTRAELDEVLGEEAELVARFFNVQPDGNFADEASREKTGANILHRKRPLGEVAEDLGITEEQLAQRVEAARLKLFAHREQRVHPPKDDKVLTDWNGLMIAALAKAARAFDEPVYAQAAERAARFLLDRVTHDDGRLLHRYRDGEAALLGYAADYAFLTWGLLELYETTFEVGYLETASSLNEELLGRFWDGENGGFFTTADDAEELLVRHKESYDGAVPSANSVGMWNLLRLGRITGNPELEEKAARLSRAFSNSVVQAPMAYTQWLIAVGFALGPSYEVVIVGEPGADDTQAMLRALRAAYVPNKVVVFRPDTPSADITEWAPYTAAQRSLDGKATAYVCQDHVCQLPATVPEEMLAQLEQR